MQPKRLLMAAAPVMLVLLPYTAAGNSPPSFFAERGFLDRALKATLDSATRNAALQLLEDVADGKPKEMVIESALRAGLGVFVRTDFSLTDATVRAYAMDRIGASGLPEAIEYLRSVTVDKIGPDSTQTIYPASQVALNNAILLQETDPGRQVEFLEQQLPSHGAVANWAMNELCNRGSTRSLGEIAKLTSWWGGPRSAEQLQFCRVRMEIVNRGPDRVAALASALSIDEALRDRYFKLTQWIIDQLLKANSDEANVVLDRFAMEIDQRFLTPRLLLPRLKFHRCVVRHNGSTGARPAGPPER